MKKLLGIMVLIMLLNGCAGAPVGWGGKYEVIQSNSESITIKYDTILGKNAIYETCKQIIVKKFDKEPVPTTKTFQMMGIAVSNF